jgi:ribosomal protein S18 acetylase RimI-like enzyme
MIGGVRGRIRLFVPSDEETVVQLSLRAWAPVFASMENVLGRELQVRLHGEDWRLYQARNVRTMVLAEGSGVWVWDSPPVVGFVAARVGDPNRQIGVIQMLAVDPDSQERGIGTSLTEHATNWLRDKGMRVAAIGTGGDEGHAPARRVYEKADYTLLPQAGYYKAL